MWDNLNEKQKARYKEYCDSKYGKTIMFCETGEPMYLDFDMNMVDTEIIINLLFKNGYENN